MLYRTKEDLAADHLREKIISGTFERGSRLKQAEVAAMLGLSTTPVREAMKLLEAEGYVTQESHRGVVVSPFDRHTSDEVVGLRILLEERLLRAAVERITDKELAELQTLEKSLEQAIAEDDWKKARGINYRFHRALVLPADLPQTFHFMQVLWARYPFDLITKIPKRGPEVVKEHRQLLRCVEARDLESAAQALRKHIQSGWERLQSRLSDAPSAPQTGVGGSGSGT